MEAVVGEISNKEILPEKLTGDVKEGMFNSESNFMQTPRAPSPVEDQKLEFNSKSKKNQDMNGFANEGSLEPEKKDSKESESVSQQSASPTIIEQAFKAVKNLFSPEKVKSKPQNIINTISQQRSVSASPSNIACVLNKPEISISTCESSNTVQSSPAENSLKREHYYLNQLGIIHSSTSLDSHNNTDDSFLTSVSLFEESFQSAVTHLDENLETLKNDAKQMESVFNNSRDLDTLDPNNDTFDGGEYFLENTLLRNGSFTCEETKLDNISTKSKEGNSEVFDIADLINSNDENSNYQVTATESVNKTQNSGGVFTAECEVVKGNSFDISEKIGVTNLFTETQCNYLLLTNCNLEDKKTENSQDVLSNKVVSVEKDQDIENPSEMVGLLLIKSREKDSKNNTGEQEDKFEENECSRKENEREIKICGKNDINILNDEQESFVESSISTTTVILGPVDSTELEDLTSLKKSSDTNISFFTTFEKYPQMEDPCNTANQSIILNPTEGEITVYGDECDVIKDRYELGTPGETLMRKPAQHRRNNLNKSVDLKNHKGLSKPYLEESPLNLEQGSVPVDTFLTSNTEASDLNLSGGMVNDDFESLQLGSSKDKMRLPISQQSYTVLSPSRQNLNRPVICSKELVIDFCNESSDESSKGLDLTYIFNSRVSAKSKVDAFLDSPSDNTNLIRTPKQSTPIGELASSKPCKILLDENTQGVVISPFNLSPLEEKQSLDCGKKNIANVVKTVENSFEDINPKSSLSDDIPNIPSLIEEKVENSPITTINEGHFAFTNSLEKEIQKAPSPQKAADLNSTWVLHSKPTNEINQTFNKKQKSPLCNKLNQTFVAKPGSLLPNKLNTTFIKKSDFMTNVDKNPKFPSNEMNQTFEKESEDILGNQPKHLEGINRTFDKKEIEKLNVTFKKDAEIVGVNNLSNLNKSFEKKTETTEQTQTHRSIGERVEEETFSSEFPVILEENVDNKISENFELVTAKDNLNGSSISTASSNTSLLCNSTVLLNQGGLSDNPEVDELSDKVGELSLSGNSKIKMGSSDPLLEDDKLQYDSDLVQLIQEQFSSTDIEKICSVVDDMSKRLCKDILKASQEFDKSYHESLSESFSLPEQPQSKAEPEKIVNALSPQSFDFLNSIGGKPTGRDLSRESLYVKFDPLVQPPNGNSLIDFTKEGEALATDEVLSVASVSDNFCEQLLTISPNKKSDDIVPPLTPLSHKRKEDKIERLNELQNEIYFLKNLYAERERVNKVNIDDYESQIAKLTGESLMLEDKLKNSVERERSLVKKLKEQTQSMGQINVIMEEYVRAITKLSTEVEEIRGTFQEKIATLTADKDSYVLHLQNTEAAFTDVHTKYEKSKKTIVNLKANEVKYKRTIMEQSHKLEDFKKKAKEAQEKALKEFQKIQKELDETKGNQAQEMARLKAQLRKTELKVEALQESLDQKIKENQQLTAICDELIEGRK